MRSLATIQRIKSLEPIPGKDKIVYASFEGVGFRVIVSKDIQVGESVVYCEVDSLLPVKPEFEFLRARCFNDKLQKFRIRNMKLANLYSEGIVFKLDILPSGSYSEGKDVTDILGIKKYDAEALEEVASVSHRQSKKKWWLKFWVIRKVYNWFKKRDDAKYVWPSWASKSDECRAQNINFIFDKYQGQEFFATEKLDGSSMLLGVVKGRFYVCSRNINLKKDPQNQYWKFVIENDLERILINSWKKDGKDFYVQGELIGPKIQGNKYKLDCHRYYIFNLKLLYSEIYASYSQIEILVEEIRRNKIRTNKVFAVPWLQHFTWDYKSMTELLEFSKGESVLHPIPREGVVIRSVKPMPPDRGQSNMMSFKVINPDFEIKFS